MATAPMKLLGEYPKVWSAHDIDRVVSFFTEDCIYRDVVLHVEKHGQDGIREFAELVFGMQPDFHIEYSDYFATDTQGAAVWTITTTWQGEFGGVDVTGNRVEFTGTTIFQFRDGKILRNTDYWDLTPVMLQLGTLTEELRKCR